MQYVKELFDAAKTVALVSDAGTPLISDPGYKIVANLRKENYKVVPIPGVSAVITALSAAGLPSDSFIFKGFLSAKQSKRQQQIREFQQINTTVILYESVHRINYLLEDLLELMPNANIVVAKELTKQFENFVFGSVQQIYDYFQANQDTLRGEFVVIIDCNFDSDVNNNNLKIDVDELLKDLLDDIPLSKVVKLVTKITGAKKNLVYEKALKLKNASLS